MPDARYVVRVLRAGSSAATVVGFVVGDREVLTRAHVVNAALGREQRTHQAPGLDVRVQVDFPTLGGVQGAPSWSCRVAACVPPPDTGTHGGVQPRQRSGLQPVSVTGDDLVVTSSTRLAPSGPLFNGLPSDIYGIR
ncbi:MAG: hypothetical protein JO063_06575 [Pseudonocardiales bacterium]|nr:hypothetical protein [Pseudonocardiales bacterium]MBV9030740.1 hypothetical protein [Pseudonocardiales bacterium]MBW0009767.1 hypothetical protein [Pseudonocardiales bacterium]